MFFEKGYVLQISGIWSNTAPLETPEMLKN